MKKLMAVAIAAVLIAGFAFAEVSKETLDSISRYYILINKGKCSIFKY